MKNIFPVVLMAAALVFTACSKDTPRVEENTITLSKSWFVRMEGPATTTDYSLFSTRPLTVVEFADTHNVLQTQRLLKDTIAVDDHNQLAPALRANLKIDVQNLSFGPGLYKNWHSEDSVILKEGRIIKEGGRSRSGIVVDSLFLRIAFQSDPTTDYRISGHSRTGLLADEF